MKPHPCRSMLTPRFVVTFSFWILVLASVASADFQIGDRVTYTLGSLERPGVITGSKPFGNKVLYEYTFVINGRQVTGKATADRLKPRAEKAEIDGLVGVPKPGKGNDGPQKETPLGPLPDLPVTKIEVPGPVGRVVVIEKPTESFWKIKPTPARPVKMAAESVPLRTKERLDRLWLVDEANGLIAGVTKPPFNAPPQLHVVSLGHGRVIVDQKVPAGWDVVDVSPSGRKVLLRKSGSREVGLAVWNLSDGEGEKLVALTPVKADDRTAMSQHAQFVGDEHVLATDGRASEAALIAAADGSIVYRVQPEGRATIRWTDMLCDGRWLIGIALGDLIIVDTHAGSVGGVQVNTKLLTATAGLSADGQRLVMLDGHGYIDLNAGSGQPRASKQSLDMGNYKACDVISDRFVLLNHTQLYDLNAQAIWWRYGSPVREKTSNSHSDERVVYGGRLWYIVNDSAKGAALNSVPLPGEDAEQAQVPANMLALGPGMAVEIDVDVEGGAAEQQKVREALEAAAKAAGFKVAAQANVKLVARTEEDRERETSYLIKQGNVGQITGSETVKVRDKISVLTVAYDGKEIWKRIKRVGPPGSVALVQGETFQETVQRLIKYDLDFFGEVELPARVFNPEHAWGLGETPLK